MYFYLIMDLNNKYIVFFDGDCNLCNFWVRQVLKNERKENIYFSSLNSSFSKKTLHSVEANTSNLNSIIVLYQDRIYTKSEAISLILKQLKFPYPFFSFVLSFLPTFFTNFFYDLIAKYRLKMFGKSENCNYGNFHKRNKILE